MESALKKLSLGAGFAALLRTFANDLAQYAGRRGLSTAALVLAAALLEGFGLLLIVPLLGIVTSSGAGSGRFERIASDLFARLGIADPTARLGVLLGAFALLMVARALVIAARDLRVARWQIEFVEMLRLRIVSTLAAAPWSRILKLRHARITHLLSGDILRIGVAASILLRTAVAFVMLIAQAVLVFVLAPAFATIVFLVLLVSALVFAPVVRQAHRLGTAVTGGNLALLDRTGQFLGGLKLAISQNLQHGFVSEFQSSLQDLRDSQLAFQRRQIRSGLVYSIFSALFGAALVLIGFGGFHASAATLIAVLVVIARMTGPAMQIQQGLQQLASVLPAYEAVKELESDLSGGAAPVAPIQPNLDFDGPIVFENVGFQHLEHDDGHETHGVRDVSLRFEPGEFVGITGPSGAGKTTFADLLVGLIRPQHGTITVAGVGLTDAALPCWRERVAYVAQDAFLFNDSVRRNLAWARPAATEEEMWAALELAGAADLIRRMERGLDTMVGERGALVSGGERQRIALARAVLRKPLLLVLDEATSAIDVAGETLVLQRLRSIRPRPTIILIAHRAESAALCDRVLHFDAGRPVRQQR